MGRVWFIRRFYPEIIALNSTVQILDITFFALAVTLSRMVAKAVKATKKTIFDMPASLKVLINHLGIGTRRRVLNLLDTLAGT